MADRLPQGFRTSGVYTGVKRNPDSLDLSLILSDRPAVASGVVYIGSTDSFLYAINSEDGKQLWKYRTADKIFTSPTVSDGLVYFNSVNGSLYAVK
jgi:outer membrane protein assembly factor BamB